VQYFSFGLKIEFITKAKHGTCLCDNHIKPTHIHCVKIHFLNLQLGATGRNRRRNMLLKLFSAIFLFYLE
jgi:hypothetical protein